MALLAAALAIPAGASHARPAAYPAYPAMTMKDGLESEKAIEALGSNIGSVAAWYGWSTHVLKREFAWVPFEKRLRLDRFGQIYIYEKFQDLDPRTDVDFGTSTAEWGRLHSRPEASRKIVLSFNGATLTGTAWNGPDQSGVNYLKYGIDTDASTISPAEASRIVRIWESVADDFAPFDVDVTTEDTAGYDLQRDGADDTTYGIRVVIYRGVKDCPCDGKVYVRSFGDPTKPILLNTMALGNGDPVYVANAVSHLLGHALGLREDMALNPSKHGAPARLDSSYGEELAGRMVVPIMGDSTDAPVSRFAAGNYPGAKNGEPDVAIIVQNGLPILADDAGNTAILAKYPDAGSPNLVNLDGLIERPGDRDVYAIHAKGGQEIKAVVKPYRPSEVRTEGANLNLELQLWSARSKQNASVNVDAATQAATLTYTPSTPGTYFLVVRPVKERSDAKAGIEYGNRGRYSGTFTASVPDAGLTLPVATLTTSFANGQTRLQANKVSGNSIVHYRWNFGDGSPVKTTTLPHYDKAYSPGTYRATVQVIDRNNFATSATTTVVVPDPSSANSVAAK